MILKKNYPCTFMSLSVHRNGIPLGSVLFQDAAFLACYVLPINLVLTSLCLFYGSALSLRGKAPFCIRLTLSQRITHFGPAQNFPLHCLSATGWTASTVSFLNMLHTGVRHFYEKFYCITADGNGDTTAANLYLGVYTTTGNDKP